MARDPHLDKLIQDIKTKKFRDGEAKGLMERTGEELTKQFGPALEGMGKELSKTVTDALKSLRMPDMPAMPEHKMPEIPAPIVNIPDFKIPTPQVTVNVPDVIVPPIIVPETKVSFPTLMKVLLDGIDRKNPIPVMMVDLKGQPFYQFGGSDSGPKVLSDITYQGRTLIDVTTPSQPALRISGTISAAAASSVSLVNADGTYYNSDNPLPITNAGVQPVSQVSGHNWSVFATNPVAQGDSATALRVVQAGDVASSVSIVSITGPIAQGDAASALRVVLAGNADTSVVVNSGTITTVTTVTGITNSLQTALIDSSGVQYSGSNPVPVTGTVAATKSGTWTIDNPVAQGDAATALRVVIAGNSDSSVSATQVGTWNIGTVTTVTSITNSTAVALTDSTGVQYSGSNPLPVTIPSPVAQGDAAAALRVLIAGNSDSSVVVNSGTLTAVTNITNSVAVVALDRDGNPLTTGPIAQGDAATALRVILAGNADSSVSVTSITGPIAQGDAASALRVLIAGNSDSSVVVNSGTITTVTTVTGITNSLQTALIDSTGVQYSGSNPVPITVVSGALTSTIAVGDTLARTADIGAAPVKVGGIAGSTNPTKYADGDRANFRTDLLGRQLMRPHQVRDLIATAYVTLSTGTEATLLAASAGNFYDLIYIMGANTSTAAVQVDVRAVTAGNILMSLYIPGNATAGVALPVPFPQDATGNNWTVDMGDFTNSNVLISALFSKES